MLPTFHRFSPYPIIHPDREGISGLRGRAGAKMPVVGIWTSRASADCSDSSSPPTYLLSWIPLSAFWLAICCLVWVLLIVSLLSNRYPHSYSPVPLPVFLAVRRHSSVFCLSAAILYVFPALSPSNLNLYPFCIFLSLHLLCFCPVIQRSNYSDTKCLRSNIFMLRRNNWFDRCRLLKSKSIDYFSWFYLIRWRKIYYLFTVQLLNIFHANICSHFINLSLNNYTVQWKTI